jgi:hypothetical protein
MAIAPHLVREAVRLGIIAPGDTARFLYDIPPAPTPSPDPFAELTYEQRIAAVIRACSSGVAAFSSIRLVVEDSDGNRLPPPPSLRQ